MVFELLQQALRMTGRVLHFSHSVHLDVECQGGGDVGSLTLGCSATPIRCKRWRLSTKTFVIHPVRTTTPSSSPLPPSSYLNPPTSTPLLHIPHTHHHHHHHYHHRHRPSLPFLSPLTSPSLSTHTDTHTDTQRYTQRHTQDPTRPHKTRQDQTRHLTGRAHTHIFLVGRVTFLSCALCMAQDVLG